LVARLLWVQDVVGSNPAAPTELSTRDAEPFVEGAERSHGAAQAPCGKGVTNGRPLTRKLVALTGERERLLSVGEVADHLGGSTATVYKLCSRGDLGHLLVLNSIRVRLADLVSFINGSARRL
jgi:Helix-turn-helix domain